MQPRIESVNSYQTNPYDNLTNHKSNGATSKVALENEGFEIQLPKSRGFQEVIDYIDLIKEEFMKDPHSLSGCGHIHDEDTLTTHFFQNNKKKFCPNPDCKTPYTSMSRENWLRQQIEKYISELNEPSLGLKQSLSELCDQLPNTLEKVTILELIELFNKGQCEEASRRLTSMMRTSMNSEAYVKISSLMDTHVSTLKDKHSFTIRNALSHRSENGTGQNSFDQLQGNEPSSSTSSNIHSSSPIFVLDVDEDDDNDEDSETMDEVDKNVHDDLPDSNLSPSIHSSPIVSTRNENENQPPAPDIFSMIKKKNVLNWTSFITEESVKSRDAKGNTPLHCYAKRYSTLYLVLRHHFKPRGADFNAKNKVGDTPLHLAVRRGGNAKQVIPQVIRPLRYCGARTDIRNNAGQLPIDCTNDEAIKEALK